MTPSGATSRRLNSRTYDVELRVERPGARRVEVAGEIGDWLAPAAMEERAPGVFVRRLSLAEGVYAYKLRVDGAWELDAQNPRTRARGALRDNLLAVGGAAEPLLFAAAPPFLREEDDGGVTVIAGLRRGAGERLEIVWTEGGGAPDRRTAMRPLLEEDEHVLFAARLPWSAARARFVFAIDGARRVGRGDAEEPFVHARARLEDGAPAWWRDAIVYAIFVDRFRAAHDDASWGADPGPDVAAGGHLEGVARSLDELRDLGATVLYLTPTHVAASCHRYDVVDPLTIDPALGGEEAFARLVESVHARGMRLVVDFALSHAGRGFPPFEDVLARGPASPYAPWFQWKDGALVHYGERRDAPLFDLDHPDVRDLAMRALEAWAARGVDGIRLDAAAEVPLDLACALRARLRTLRPDAVVLGEVVPAHRWRWLAAGAVDATTDFAFHRVSCEALARGTRDVKSMARELAAADVARGGGASTAVRFVSTHDHARFATLARVGGRAAHAALGLVHVLTSPGVPALLYGEEVGLAADVAELAPEAAWRDRAPMPWGSERRDLRLRALVKRLLALRAESRALRHGDVETLFADDGILVYRRGAGGDVIDVALNAGDAPAEVAIEDADHPALEPLATVGDVVVSGQAVTLGPGAAIVARRAHGGRPRARLRVLQMDQPRRREAAFASRAYGAAPWPARIDLAITERCNLRCHHCITDAPERTRSGAARTLSPWLLDRLRDALAFAEYVGFVHGGEPLAAPILHDVLLALRAARSGFPYVAHLLTNGLLLGEQSTRRLVEEGVRSISVSLDGATAASNDAVRAGGRFETVVEHVREAVRVRRALGVDLRLGISAVVMRTNLEELDAIVELAARVGVDWIKLEELVPVNPFSARSLVAANEPRAHELVARAVERGRALGLIVVDHFDPPPVWRCKLAEDPRMRAFHAADEHANRARIDPCRAPYERACIDPDGEVHVGDFFGPAVGNVAHAPLAELWNAPVARAERLRAEIERPCGSGAMTCLRTASSS